MSAQEIYAMGTELAAMKNFIEKHYGVVIKTEKTLNIDEELLQIKKELSEFTTAKLSIDKITERIEQMYIDLTKLTEEVTRAQTVQSSAVMLIKQLATELESISAQLAAKAAEQPPTFDPAPLDDLINKLKGSSEELAGAVAASAGVIPMKEVILHADNPAVPTVSVTMPEVMPEVVSVTSEVVVDKVDPVSPEPQVQITVEAAPEAVVTAPESVTDVIKTEEGQVDVIMAAPAVEAAEVKAETGVEVLEEVKAAFEATPEVVAAPVEVVAPVVEPVVEAAPEHSVILNADNPAVPTVEVILPEVMPEVVTVAAETIVPTVDPASPEPQVVITVEAAPAAEVMVDKTADVDVIKTDEGQVDVVVAAPAVVVDEMAKVNVDVVEEVKAAFEAIPEVVATPEAPAPEVVATP